MTLGSLFGKDIYKSPQIPHKANTRELTDILAFSQYGIFLIEAKALGVISVSEGRTMERKVAGLQKQIEKAIRQLVGASKKVKENVPIYNTDNNDILFDRTLLPHGIVLVSELFAFGDWDKTIMTLLQAMSEFNIYIHVMEMKEFMRFIGYSKGDKNKFDYFLVERIKNFVNNLSIINQSEFVDRSSIT